MRLREDIRRRMPTLETDPPARAERHLAAILATDVVGYSRQMERDEVGTLRRLRDLRQNLIEPKVAEHRGRVFKTMGDGFLAEFGSALDAVHCAVDIQRLMAARNLDLPEDGRLQLRVGINLGDVFHEGEDVFGDGVNIAARLESIAPPGGIYVSRAACDPIRERFAFDFEDLGDHHVKNITRPIQVFSVRIEGAVENGPAENLASVEPAPERASAGETAVFLKKPQPPKRRRMLIGGPIAVLLVTVVASGWYFGLDWRKSPPPADTTAVAPNTAPPPAGSPPNTPPASPVAAPAPPSIDTDLLFWQSISESNNMADFAEYLRKYPQGRFADLARNRIAALRPSSAGEFLWQVSAAIGQESHARIVGDRFVFQAELLFAKGTADLTNAGKERLDSVVSVLKGIISKIQSGLDWKLRVDAHTDHPPSGSSQFASQWELSAARAGAIVQYAIEKGISPERVNGMGFADKKRLDQRDIDTAHFRNERIEFSFTDK